MNSNFELNLSRVLAHTLVYESNPHNVELYCGGGPENVTTGESMNDILQAMQKNLPGLSQVQAENLPTIERALFNITRELAPQYSQVQTDIYKQQAPELAATGQDIQDMIRQRTAETEAGLLREPGQDVARGIYDIQGILEPEYQPTAAAAGQVARDLLQFGPNEQRSIEQAMSRTSPNYAPSASSDIANALRFAETRRGMLGQALQQATQTLPQLRSGYDPLLAATGRPSQNLGLGNFLGSQNLGQSGLGFGQQAFGAATDLQKQYNQQQFQMPTAWDRAMQGSQIFKNVGSGVGGIMGM